MENDPSRNDYRIQDGDTTLLTYTTQLLMHTCACA